VEKKKWSFILVGILLVTLVSAIGTTHAARKGVFIADQNWPSAGITAQIMKFVLENKLNIPVTLKPMTVSAAWVGMDQDQVDVNPEVWVPLQQGMVEKYVEGKKTVELTESFKTSANGLVVPTWVSREYGIKAIADLNQHSKIFDLTGNKGGDIWVGSYGWRMTEIMKIKIRDYGLKFNPLELQMFAFYALLKEKMRVKKPIIFQIWEPDWIFAKYDLTYIKEPPHDPKKWIFKEGKPEESKITCGDRPNTVYLGYNRKLKDRVPKAYKFFKNWYMPKAQVDAILVEAEDVPGNPKKPPLEVAKKWVEDHPEILKDWLKGIK